MGKLLDVFYTLTEEELYYRKLWQEGRSRAEFIILPYEVQERARLEEKIVLSRSYYSREYDDSIVVLKHPVFMPRYLHSHQFVELTWLMSGSVEESIEGQNLRARQGSLVVIMPGFYHSIWTDDENTVAVNMLVDRDLFQSLDSRFGLDLRGCIYALFDGLDFSQELEEMLDEDGHRDGESRFFKEVALEHILLKLSRQGQLIGKVEGGERKEVYKIMGYLEEHSRDVTLSSFASDFNISEQYASRLIREKTGLSFSEIVRKLRMEEAALLLRGGKLSSKEISYRVGYSSPEHFSRTFKAYFGLSPEAWKKANASI